MTQVAADDAEAQPRRGGGRPTRAEAARREARIVEVATRLFMERGFDATSIDAVAEAAGVSKPTLYSRYRDKRALFEAVLDERIREWLAPLSAAAETQALEANPRDAATVLDELSRNLLARAHAPGAAALTRCIAAQAMQFPDLARLAYEEGWMRGVRAVGRLLTVMAARGQIAVDDAEIAADLFLNLVLGRSAKQALYGIAVDPEAQEKRRRAAVALFLAGCRPLAPERR
ncbi:TetR/AcrR family transcriptional regulator [Methylobacterium sp. WL30]|jgi:TetR/AcrR family transcriptional repressor of mexJK operon|uniref:TetR/AcrR family transcriptional regulator n=2 Tax=Methylobacterium TaxID=407 RepID=UPI0011CC25F3|nr:MULTISPECIES: TetR/AcrR family transcriptional regulator [unclassified Methylobacterium]MCJ2010365.1 TetR/AcrR family transcriptional regulator [Methylobacterium sp. J-092]MCJ2042476.1 TetR/AcrR family transcriptional regulator [Methylobacterium sp. J-059]MCJ2077334.1 TetR/AcrR family transcriptional regulator [Methylobacterium sp. E-016]TXN36602.1 TetR/AcrR family transcriptional regulator [Methylobacterium sp. WL93]TXN47566.1 TetR/AcrR family transcriptional regulator [Methylobacterium sp